MKKLIYVLIIVLITSVNAFGQTPNNNSQGIRLQTVEETATNHSDIVNYHCSLNEKQYRKVHKLYVKQVKRDERRIRRLRRERERMCNDMKHIMTHSQYVKYVKIYNSPSFINGSVIVLPHKIYSFRRIEIRHPRKYVIPHNMPPRRR
jgi:hypothetical protein